MLYINLIFFVGTTGVPKCVKVPHKCVVPNVTYFIEKWEITSNDIVLLSSPIGFDPSVIDIFIALGTLDKIQLRGSNRRALRSTIRLRGLTRTRPN